MFMLPGGYAGIAIGDVCDKGVGSALFMALFRSLIRIYSRQAFMSQSGFDPRSRNMAEKTGARTRQLGEPAGALRAIRLTNDYIAREHNEMCMFATVFFSVLNPETGELFYANGGHEPIFVLHRGGIEHLGKTGPAVGLIEGQDFEIRKTSLHPGETLFAYTDGVTDARSPADDLFGRKRLSTLLEQPAGSAKALLERIKSELFDHIDGAPLEDDITILILERRSI